MRLLIWDFDGTLGYQKRGYFSESIVHVIREIDPETTITAEQIRPYLRTGFPWHTPEQPHLDISSAEQWWERLYPIFQRAVEGAGFTADRAAACARKVRAVYTEPGCWELYEDTLPALERLSSRGWIHVILSNHVPELPDILHRLGLDNYLGAIFCSAQTGYEKPHPNAFSMVLAAYPDANPVWMIGDNPEADFAGARRCGLRAILVRKPHPGIEQFGIDLNAVEKILEQNPF
jgi:putative hydrolase of the HAD superfamily